MHIEYFMVFGYLFISMAIGAFCIGAAVDLWKTVKEGTKNHSWAAISRTAAIISLPLVIIGIALTLFHLGRIERFFTIILNSASWLTREAWSAGLFALLSLLYFLQWRRDTESSGSGRQRAYLGALGIFFGFTTILSMSMIYSTVKAIPAWNTTLIFYLNLSYAFALGVFLLGAVAAYNKTKGGEWQAQVRSLTGGGFLAVLLIALTYFTYQLHLSILPHAVGTAIPTATGLLTMRILIGIILPLLMIGYAWFNSNKKPTILPIALISSFVLIVAGDIMARMLHFIMAVQPPLF